MRKPAGGMSAVRAGMILAGLLLIGAATAASGACPDGVSLPEIAAKTVVVAGDTLFFAARDLQLDHDGSPSVYGVRDQGLENICNGLGPLQPPQCRGQNRGPCFTACQTAFASWSRSGADVATLGQFMCSIGLGGGGCSVPQARLQDAPRQAWFISETAVHVSPPSGAPDSHWIASQAAQLDPAVIPYFVIPGGFRRLPWDATPGDAGVIVDARANRTAAFVVGDIGGALDEASTSLHTALRGGVPPAKGTRTSALGEPVESFLSGTSGDFRVAIFRHTSKRLAGSTTLSLTSDDLPAWIETTAKLRLAAIGGPDRVMACTQP